MVIQGGIGEKMTGAIQHTVTFVAGLIVGFTTSWKLTLVILAFTPMLVGVLVVLKNSISQFETDANNHYARAGDASNEALSQIRTVCAYGGEAKEVSRYETYLLGAEKAGVRKGMVLALCVGGIFGSMFLTYAGAMGAGARFILDSRAANPACRYDPTTAGCFSGGDVIQVFMAVLIGAFSLGQAGPNIAALSSAQATAGPLFAVIDEVPAIDSDAPPSVTGSNAPPPTPSVQANTPAKIEFRNVVFRFPSRPETLILNDFSLLIPPGKTLALVGESGSGKSTLIQLILRFYDCEAGAVLVDDLDVRHWDLKQLRGRIGFVSQEPLLFAKSVRENIGMGREGGCSTPQEIETAARAASAHDFIITLTNGYDTLVGVSTSSTQLSGGQRQRLCIARALLREPRLLLLDEATSALDTESERSVQAAIDNLLGEGKRTAVVIAHRLSTVINADMIVVLSKGRAVECGTHKELLERGENGGVYAALWNLQNVAASSGGGGSEAGIMPLSRGTIASSDTAHTTTTTITKKSDFPRLEEKAVTAGSTVDSKGVESVWDALKETNSLPKVSRFRVWALQREDAWLIILALLGSAGSGVVQPVFGLIYSEFIAVFFTPSDAYLQEKTGVYCGAFVGVALAVFLCTALRIGGFSVLGERLTRKLRVMSYRAVLRQPMSFFDQPLNSVGRLTTRLQADAADVRLGTGETVGQTFQAGSAVIAAVVIALTASWRLALIVLAAMPLQVIGAAYGNQAFVGFGLGAKKALEESGHLAVEAMAGLRTVAAFNLQESTLSAFADTLKVPHRAGVKKALTSGVAFGFSSVRIAHD